MVVELHQDAVAIIATKNSENYTVEHGVALWIPDAPGRMIAFTTLETLQFVSGGGEIAWEMSQGGHDDEDVEDYLLAAIYEKCGCWVPLSIMCLD